jgi:hypothetical protein
MFSFHTFTNDKIQYMKEKCQKTKFIVGTLCVTFITGIHLKSRTRITNFHNKFIKFSGCLLLACLLLIGLVMHAQVGIGTTTPNSSAQLDISSTSKGLLPPRMTYVQKMAIAIPPAGLMIWCSNCGSAGEMQVYNGTEWTNMIGGSTSFAPLVVGATTAASFINNNSALSGGSVISDGGTTVTARGICWNTSTNPTILLTTKTSDGTGTGTFTSNITGLAPGVTYYVRAYATNSAGTTYGAEISFTTSTSLPFIAATTAVSSITTTTATSGGTITADGGTPVTARGVCWSTSTNPTTALSTKTTNGTGTGAFSSNLTGLSHNTTYYVRAYATNINGTAYGSEVSFNTPPVVGDSYQGGIVAYIFSSTDPGYVAGQTHGLIAAVADQSSGIQWYNGTDLTGMPSSTGLGTGNSNTNAIVTAQGAGSYAAKICYDLVEGGYSDWYLPSKDELNILYLNRAVIGGFGNNIYWASCSPFFGAVWVHNFSNGFQFNSTSSFPRSVRAIRSF